jgi:hypothetical protein
VGHRLISALIFLNALGLVLCVVLITAAVSSDEPARVVQVSEAVKLCLRLFVAGAALPTVAWGILAFEFDRSHSKKKLLESIIVYIVLIMRVPVSMLRYQAIGRQDSSISTSGPTMSLQVY